MTQLRYYTTIMYNNQSNPYLTQSIKIRLPHMTLQYKVHELISPSNLNSEQLNFFTYTLELTHPPFYPNGSLLDINPLHHFQYRGSPKGKNLFAIKRLTQILPLYSTEGGIFNTIQWPLSHLPANPTKKARKT